jgi:hypothetical protein
LLGENDDEIPPDADLLQLSRSAFKSRLERFSKKELRAHFGSDNIDEIKGKLAKFSEYETKAEEERRKTLSEQDRLKEDIDKATKRAEAAEQRAQQLEETHQFEQEETKMSRLAERFIDPDYIDAELSAFAKHLRKTYTKEQAEKLTEKDFEEYWTKRVEAKPKLAKDYEEKIKKAAGDGKTPETPPKPPLTNGAAPNKPGSAAPSGGAQPKTYSPSGPNAMSTAEARQKAGAEGYRW